MSTFQLIFSSFPNKRRRENEPGADASLVLSSLSYGKEKKEKPSPLLDLFFPFYLQIKRERRVRRCLSRPFSFFQKKRSTSRLMSTFSCVFSFPFQKGERETQDGKSFLLAQHKRLSTRASRKVHLLTPGALRLLPACVFCS